MIYEFIDLFLNFIDIDHPFLYLGLDVFSIGFSMFLCLIPFGLIYRFIRRFD